MTADYRDSVFLPQTDFPMKAGLPKKEPELLARWRAMDLFRRMRERASGREKFILHDGPPYANGNIHIGHALNKILKDVIARSQQMLGKDSNYVPGWDCHGLPIEWKIEEQYRKANKSKDEVPIVEFRKECREFAEHWIGVQMEEFRRLGVEGDWANPYTTMSFAAEAQIVRELLKFLMNGGLYRGSKPVMWSIVEKTALAEAEVEYHEHSSPTIWVRFPVLRSKAQAAVGARIVIWTTTPWTIPGNRGIALKADARYVKLRVDAVAEGALASPGEEIIVAADLAQQVQADAKIERATRLAVFDGADLTDSVCAHPWRGRGYDFDVPVMEGGFVTMDQGTGFVHIAPGHGTDDFELGQTHGLELPFTVAEDGSYYPHVPLVAGRKVLTADGKEGDANGAVIKLLIEAGALLAKGRLKHSYPHSWRSKAPLIFRNTPQWFISMTTNGLREKALAAIDQVRWVPPQGRNRLHAMIQDRPDWVISRQRAWGVPITVFVDRRTGEPLRDERVNRRIADAVEAEGADAWFASEPARFLAPEHDPANFEKVDDILDVWFDSGSTHSYVLEQRPELKWPASLYLEGSDQHRGWFHSSLLESCGTRGRAPYEAVLTHGFTLDEHGRKMSKSLGNVVAPQQVIDQYGADILRLWVVSCDYTEDQRIGPEILKNQAEAYRKIRNTLRYLLGNLAGFDEAERLDQAEMPELERWVLHRLHELDGLVRQGCEDFDFHAVFVAIYNFCISDLSAFYFDIRKDALYCDRPSAKRRRAARTVLDHLFSCLTAWLAPMLCFTAEEAWLARFPGEGESVHLRTFPALPAAWRDDTLARKWAVVREVRRVVTGALEIERREKRIGASLQAAPTIHAGRRHVEALAGLDLAEICITSAARLVEGGAPDAAFRLEDVQDVAVVPGLAEGAKCQRCWQVLPEVGQAAHHDDLCHRCDEAIGSRQA
ncbi:MAG: isoleucine--tRNA ligase [Alphaproteobacteria bacterium]|nr:isoleucine--tRNA ligase [Alphaproteobacteria bacterium]